MKIAVCDKDKLYLEQLKTLLSESYFKNKQRAEVVCFSNSCALLEYLYHQQIDVVILDLMIDELSGIDVARRIRAAQGNYPKLIFLSSINGCAAETYEVNASTFLLKPVDKDKLKLVLDKMI